ncbi:MAG TPA: hypothetical protein VGM62_19685 [Chthoniobacterales bacterium]|jgi:hypothetical protein
MKWEELIAEARTNGFLRFLADGIAILERPVVNGPEQPPTEPLPA